MEEKKKNEELQNHREFFKTAAKKSISYPRSYSIGQFTHSLTSEHKRARGM